MSTTSLVAKTTIAAAVAAAGLNVPPGDPAAASAASGTALTVYSRATPGAVAPELYRQPGRGTVPGYAVVRQERELEFARGRNMVRFADVAALIDPTTVVFESLTDGKGTTVLEQNYQFDLVSTDKLLQRYIDRPIAVEQVRGSATETFSGTLLSTQGGIVLKRDDGAVQVVPHHAGVKLPALPGGLITRPTLVWDVAAQRVGRHKTRVSYQTQGMTWWSDYNVTYAEAGGNSCRMDIGAWVSIINQSGAGYTDAKLKLVAGDVHRATAVGAANATLPASKAMQSREESAGFVEKSFFEYHLYTLGRATTLPDNSTKQIELFPAARRVPCEKLLVYYGAPAGSHGFLRHRRPIATTACNPTARSMRTYSSATANPMAWACRCRPAASASRSSTRRTRRSSSSAKTRSTIRRATRRCC